MLSCFFQLSHIRVLFALRLAAISEFCKEVSLYGRKATFKLVFDQTPLLIWLCLVICFSLDNLTFSNFSVL